MFISKKKLAERDARVKFETQVQVFAENVVRIEYVWESGGVNIADTIIHILEAAEEIVAKNLHNLRLNQLSPWWMTSQHYEHALNIGEVDDIFGGRTVPLAKVIEWHLRNCRAIRKVDRITANQRGLIYYVGEIEVLSVAGGTIYPARLNDPGNRYEVAGEMMKAFTGLEEIDWEMAFRLRASRMTVLKDPEDNTWRYMPLYPEDVSISLM